MGMHILRPETDGQGAVAAKLALGRVFGSGNAFVPFVKAALYESLAAFGGVEVGAPPAKLERGCTGSPEAPRGMSKPRRATASATWADIRVGSRVPVCSVPVPSTASGLAPEQEFDTFTLRWRDWSPFTRQAQRTRAVANPPPMWADENDRVGRKDRPGRPMVVRAVLVAVASRLLGKLARVSQHIGELRPRLNRYGDRSFVV